MIFFMMYIGVGQILAAHLSCGVSKEFPKFGERLLVFALIVIGWPIFLWPIRKRGKP